MNSQIRKQWQLLSLADRVRFLREIKNWMQKDLAEESRITQATISRIESGKIKELKWSTCRRLAIALGVSMEHLLSGFFDDPSS